MGNWAEWEAPYGPWQQADWDELFARGGANCSFCGGLVNDRRYAIALQINRAWETPDLETRWAHVDCLRIAMSAEKLT